MLVKTVIVVGGASSGHGRTQNGAGLVALESVANRPILHHALDELREVSTGGIIFAGDADALIDVRASLDAYRPRIQPIKFVVCPTMGIGHMLKAVSDLVADAACLLHPADGLLDMPAMRLLELLDEADAELLLLRGRRTPHGVPRQPIEPIYGLVDEDEPDLGVFAAGALRRLSAQLADNVDVGFTAAGCDLAAGGLSVSVRTLDGWHRNRGYRSDLLDLNRVALDRLPTDVPESVRRGRNRIEGKVAIDPTATVRASAIVGPVVIGAGATITDAYLGPYTSIGAGACIEGAEIERSIVSPGASVRHVGARLISSLVGRDTRVFRDMSLPRAMRLWTSDGDEVALC